MKGKALSAKQVIYILVVLVLLGFIFPVGVFATPEEAAALAASEAAALETIPDEEVPLAYKRCIFGWSAASLAMGLFSGTIALVCGRQSYRLWRLRQNKTQASLRKPAERENPLGLFFNLLTCVTGLLPLGFFAVKEVLAGPMVLINDYTPLVALLMVINLIALCGLMAFGCKTCRYFIKKPKESTGGLKDSLISIFFKEL